VLQGRLIFCAAFAFFPIALIQSLTPDSEPSQKVVTQKLSLKGWKRHVLGFQVSDHGKFEVEALSAEDERVHVVLLSHWHVFYEPDTPEDAERRAFHEGVVSSDLGGQKEFRWGEVICRLELPSNKDWLVVAYNRESRVPLPDKEVILRLCAHEDIPGDNP
jgi:hypothetical protein